MNRSRLLCGFYCAKKETFFLSFNTKFPSSVICVGVDGRKALFYFFVATLTPSRSDKDFIMLSRRK